jgi:hypothetical protein
MIKGSQNLQSVTRLPEPIHLTCMFEQGSIGDNRTE